MNSNFVRFIFLFIIILVISINFIFSNKNINLNNLKPYNFKIYSSNEISDVKYKTTPNGIGCVISCSYSQFEDYSKKHSYDGISFRTKLESAEILNELSAKVIYTQNLKINNITKKIIYAYSNLLDKFVMHGSQKINIQIVLDYDFCEVGMPVLLGSY